MKINYIYIGVGIVLAAIIYKIYKDKKAGGAISTGTPPATSNPSAGASASTTPAPPPTPPVATSSNWGKLLYKGVAAPLEVKDLQRALGVAVDGVFGSATESALIAAKGVDKITLSNFFINFDFPTTTTTTPAANGINQANLTDWGLYNPFNWFLDD